MAVNDALVLFAHHQQSQSQPMHRGGVRLGTAVGRLARARGVDNKFDESTLRRFQAAALAQTHDARVLLLRHLVSMMRSTDFPIPLDYGWLAADLYRFQFRASAHKVRLAWGRSLHQQDLDNQTTTPSDKEK